MNRVISILILSIIFSACKTTITKPTLPIIDNSKNVYAFIGKKISVTEFDPNENYIIELFDSITDEKVIQESYIMDNGFLCKYVVKKNLYNQLENDTIEFTAYDHYGRPHFENYDEVILYISKNENGHYFHQKYQFDNIFTDSNKRLFSYPKFFGQGYQDVANQLESFSAKFPEDQKFYVESLSEDGKKMRYPAFYYKIENNYAYPIRGMFLYELVKYRIKTTFKDL